MKVELTLCFILHSKPYLESSLLLDVFSKEYGRLDILAKGVRRSRALFSGRLQPYQRLLMSWTGKSTLMTLTDVEIDIDAYELPGIKIISGFYLNELLSRLLQRYEAHPQLFDLYDQAISDLSATANIFAILRIFEKGLLQSLGYSLVLDHDVDDGQLIEADKKYYYLSDKGPMKRIPTTRNYVEIAGSSLLSLLKEVFEEDEKLTEIKYLMRFILHKHLANKPLSSRALYKAYINNLNA